MSMQEGVHSPSAALATGDRREPGRAAVDNAAAVVAVLVQADLRAGFTLVDARASADVPVIRDIVTVLVDAIADLIRARVDEVVVVITVEAKGAVVSIAVVVIVNAWFWR